MGKRIKSFEIIDHGCEHSQYFQGCGTNTRISTVSDLKATLRAGEFAWPGGYPMFFVAGDGAALHFGCVKENLRSVIWSLRNQVDDGWRIVGCEINYEDADLYCDHCGERIESAYGEDEGE